MFEWANAVTESVKLQLQTGNLAHALLLTGPEGQGKKPYSRKLTQLMLCEHKTHCGSCKSCLLDIEFHPDVFLVQPQLPSKMVRVDQVRQLLSFMTLAPHTASCKVAMIDDCDRMNRESANALLKVLEEPPQNRFLLLTTSHAGNLLPTIKSRVNQISFPSPNLEDTAKQMETLLRQNEVLASDRQIARALKKHPHAPMLAYEYCLQKGDEVELVIYQWLHDVWLTGKIAGFPDLPQLQTTIADRVTLQQTQLKTVQLLLADLIIYSQQRCLEVKSSSGNSAGQDQIESFRQEIVNVIPQLVLLKVCQELIQLTPKLQQINVQSKINAIIQQYKPAGILSQENS